jgi:hypothetical protein
VNTRNMLCMNQTESESRDLNIIRKVIETLFIAISNCNLIQSDSVIWFLYNLFLLRFFII